MFGTDAIVGGWVGGRVCVCVLRDGAFAVSNVNRMNRTFFCLWAFTYCEHKVNFGPRLCLHVLYCTSIPVCARASVYVRNANKTEGFI